MNPMEKNRPTANEIGQIATYLIKTMELLKYKID